jgi:nucleotide-binding universal stress UspA family protein
VADECLKQGQAQLDAFAAEAPPGLPLRPVLLEGDPAARIVEFAHAERFDLIVMPTHGYGPFRRFLIGSVTAKVLHDVDSPVWTGPHLEQAPEYNAVRWRRVVCAVDLGSHTAAVVAWSGAMAKAYGSELAVVHALPASTKELGGVTFDPEWGAQAGAEARRQIAGILESLELRANIHIEAGDPPAAVRRAAEFLEADLLVIGRSITHGVVGRLRANAYAIIRESPCPVVSI